MISERSESLQLELGKFMKENVKKKHFTGGGVVLNYEREGERLKKARADVAMISL